MLEIGDVTECRERDCNDHLASVRRRGIVGKEINHIASHRRTVQRAGEQAGHQHEPIALIATDRHKKPFVCPAWVGERLPLAIYHPAFGHHLAALRFVSYLAISCDRRRHVQQDSGFLTRRHANCNRVGPEEHINAA